MTTASSQAVWRWRDVKMLPLLSSAQRIQQGAHCSDWEAVRAELREVWSASSAECAQIILDELLAQYRPKQPKFVHWLEQNAIEGVVVFSLFKARRRKMRTTDCIDRPTQQELKRRARKIRVLVDVEAFMRLVAAPLVGIDGEWLTTKAYATWGRKMTDRQPSTNFQI